ncbi:MAG: hypothetical protein AAF632_12125 [Bacteroidota bacterium]
MKHTVFAVVFSLIVGTVYSQDTSVFPAPFRDLTPVNELPETVMYTKTMVLVDAPMMISHDETWHTFAETAHQAFQETGIDAVAYYHLQDARAGRDVSRLLTGQLVSRNIKNVILLTYNPQQSNQRCGLLITTFNEKASFVGADQSAYVMTGNDWKAMMDQFQKYMLLNQYETQNFLISDLPEFFTGAGNVIKGRRAEGFAQDLKLDKLALPRHEEYFSTSPIASSDTAQILADSSTVIAQIMRAYPFEYGLVDPAQEEDQIRQDGYQFVLLRLQSSEKNLRTMLGYEESTSEASSTSEPVYKYYIKHIYTGDVYLGNTWDAAPRWQDALRNHIQYLREGFGL